MTRVILLLLFAFMISADAYADNAIASGDVSVKICKAFDDTDNIFYCFSLSPEGYEQNSFTCSGNGISYVYEPWNTVHV